MMYQYESSPTTTILMEFIKQELKEHKNDKEINCCQLDTMDQATLRAIKATYEEQAKAW